MKKKYIGMMLLLSMMLISCAGQNKLQRTKSNSFVKTKQAYHPKALEHFIRGCTSELSEDYTTALLEFTESLLYDSSSATIYNKIATNYIRLKKAESAQKILGSAIKRFPNNSESYQLLAAIYYSQHDFKRAEDAYRKIIDLDPTDIESRFSLITLLLAQGKELETAKEYEKLIAIGYGTPDIRIKVGDIYLQNKLIDKSEKIFTEFLNEFPDDERSYLAMAKLFLTRQDTVSAIAWYQKGIKKDPSFDSCLGELINLYREQKKWDSAIMLMKQSITRDVSNLENYLRLGELHYQRGDTAAAIEEFTHTIDLFPDDFRPYFSLAYLYYQQRNWEPAEKNFKKSIELNQSFSRSWITLGFLYFRNQRLDEAENHFKKAVEALPDDPHVHFLLGSVLNQRQKTDEAITYLEKCLGIDPNYVDAKGSLAMIYDGKKMYEKSDSLYLSALKERPDDPQLMNNYSYSLSVRGQNLDEAMALAQKAVEADSTNGAYLDTLGWIYFKLGDYQKALDYISRAVKFRDNSAEVLEHLGDVYEKLNDLENARIYWQRALELDNTRTDLQKRLDQK